MKRKWPTWIPFARKIQYRKEEAEWNREHRRMLNDFHILWTAGLYDEASAKLSAMRKITRKFDKRWSPEEQLKLERKT